MLQSRFSIPLIAFFVLSSAGCMLYLLKVENIFKTYVADRYASVAPTVGNDRQNIASTYVSAQQKGEKSELEKELDDTDSKSAKKFLKPAPVNPGQTTGPDVLDDNKSVSDAATLNEVKDSTAELAVIEDSHQDIVYSYATDVALLWRKYSTRIPKLYSAPLTKDTEEKLSLVGQLSGELDLLYVENKSEWQHRLDQVGKDFLMIALAGEREGARALSFQLVRPPLNNTVDALTWALIANAIASNDYYLYLCSESFSPCSEDAFLQASIKANNYISFNNFVLKK